MKFSLKSIFKDSIWTISGLVLMNIVAQFIVYPSWNNRFGSEKYGSILYLLSLMNIFAISIGSACNYIRITEIRKRKDSTSIYIVCLIIASLLVIPIVLLIKSFCGVIMSTYSWILYSILMVATMWRFYADVEYRISLNYKGYFVYYMVISIGYASGIYLSNLTTLWPLALLPGELLGLVWVLIKGKTLRWEGIPKREEFLVVLKAIVTLAFSNVLANIIFNGDRLLLKSVLDGNAVTMYYLASLLGKTISLVTTPLSSIIIGYLVRVDIKLDRRLMHFVSLISISAIIFTAFACVIVSWILIPRLYPIEFARVKDYFFIASLTQALYFITGLVMVILLRFCNSQYQLIINVVYTIGFFVIGIPATLIYGFEGFCLGLLIVSLIRFLVTLMLGYNFARRKE